MGFGVLCFVLGVLMTLAVEYAVLVGRALWLWARWKRDLEEDDPL